ncbi:hypothetical protein TNCV_2041981 [Trichonephila clavipes]|nr:hypothetical protein TNCV_2041981 [Trichonephila clavipes]
MIGKCIETILCLGAWWVSNLGSGLWNNTCSARMKRLWLMECPLTSRSSTIYKASHSPLESFSCLKQHVCVESTRLFCACQRVSSRGQASAHRIVHLHHSQGWQRSRNHVHHRESCRATLQPKDVRFNCQENARLRLVHHPLPKSVPVEYLPFCVRGKFSQLARGNRGLMVVKGLEQQKMFQELGLYAMALENLPNFKDICDGTFPDPVHEGVHEEEDISYCTMLKSYQFAKYLQQFNKLHAEWSYKVSVLTQ